MFGPRLGTGLLAGRDGWLFWVGRNRYNLRLYERSLRNAWLLRRWRGLLSDREKRCRALGARFLAAMVPDKLSVYDHKLVERAIDPDLAFSRRLRRALDEAGRASLWIQLLDPFRAERDAEDLWLRTDTHTSPAGYRLLYREICRACAVEPAAHVMRPGADRHEIGTDLGEKLVPPGRERCERHAFPRRADRVAANALTRFREHQAELRPGTQVGSRTIFRNEAAGIDGRRVVLFGTSYSFHVDGLGPMLAESFAEVHVLWSTALDDAYVARVRPDLVIGEIPERFVGRVPRDGLDVDALAAVRLAAAEGS